MVTESRPRSTLVQTGCNQFLLLMGLLSSISCGSPSPAQSPTTVAHGESNDSNDTSGPLLEGDPLGEQDTPAPEPDPMARCEGGQCFQCGDAICPEGFYCDSDSACAWLPQCAGTRLSCDCLEKQLAGCTCENSQGHPTVSCSE